MGHLQHQQPVWWIWQGAVYSNGHTCFCMGILAWVSHLSPPTTMDNGSLDASTIACTVGAALVTCGHVKCVFKVVCCEPKESVGACV